VEGKGGTGMKVSLDLYPHKIFLAATDCKNPSPDFQKLLIRTIFAEILSGQYAQ